MMLFALLFLLPNSLFSATDYTCWFFKELFVRNLLLTVTFVFIALPLSGCAGDNGPIEEKVPSRLQQLVNKIMREEASQYSKKEMRKRIEISRACHEKSIKQGYMTKDDPFVLYAIASFNEKSPDVKLFFDACKEHQQRQEGLWPVYYGWNIKSDGTRLLWCGVYVTPETIMQLYEGK